MAAKRILNGHLTSRMQFDLWFLLLGIRKRGRGRGRCAKNRSIRRVRADERLYTFRQPEAPLSSDGSCVVYGWPGSSSWSFWLRSLSRLNALLSDRLGFAPENVEAADSTSDTK